MRQIHPHGSSFLQNREGLIGITGQQAGMHAQRIVGGMPHAEHPLIAPHCSHTLAHLIGQRLEGQLVIGSRQCTRQRIRWRTCEGSHKQGYCFFEAPIEQVHIAVVGDVGSLGCGVVGGQVKAMNGI